MQDPKLLKTLELLSRQVIVRGKQMETLGELLAVIVKAMQDDRSLPGDTIRRMIESLQGETNVKV